ncbi:MAG: hypothetical protein CM15mP47_2570 [Methanobacteriota archaeon]|nr:MAG: hypothetical protein CM15mP47_2570 [Euryarchaeota archaeon]
MLQGAIITTLRFQFAAELADEHDLPLLVIEEISTSHKFANDQCDFHDSRHGRKHKLPSGTIIFDIFHGLKPHLVVQLVCKEIAKRAAIIVSDEFPPTTQDEQYKRLVGLFE